MTAKWIIQSDITGKELTNPYVKLSIKWQLMENTKPIEGELLIKKELIAFG